MPKFPRSAFATKWLGGLERGVEIGGSAHNDFGLKTINVDYTKDMNTIYKDAEESLCGEKMPVDVEAEGDDLPFPDSHFQFLINSHVIEHMPDTVGCIEEWHRVVEPGGLILFNVPNRDDSNPADKVTPYVTLAELFEDHRTGQTVETKTPPPGHGYRGHYHQWNHMLFRQMLETFFSTRLRVVDFLPRDDKVGNSFMFLCEVIKP